MISERNMEIYRRRQNGDNLKSIAIDYKLSRERVRQICFEVECDLKRAAQGEHPRKIKRDETELFQFIITHSLRRRHTIQMRAYNCLYREWCKRNGYKAGFPTMQFFIDLSYQDLCDMQNAGPQTVSYLTDLKFVISDMNGGVICAVNKADSAEKEQTN